MARNKVSISWDGVVAMRLTSGISTVHLAFRIKHFGHIVYCKLIPNLSKRDCSVNAASANDVGSQSFSGRTFGSN